MQRARKNKNNDIINQLMNIIIAQLIELLQVHPLKNLLKVKGNTNLQAKFYVSASVHEH